MRSVSGGLLVQERDNGAVPAAALKTVTRRAPSAQELADLCAFLTLDRPPTDPAARPIPGAERLPKRAQARR